ncbi:MAG: Flagellar hook protein FlgE, partial [uncultured Blastococcus sp.]
ASFHVLGHLRAQGPPDQDGRHRQQHRQRQHRRLQEQPDRLPGHAVAGDPGRWRPRRGPRWHKPRAGGPGRQGRRHHHQLDAGRHAVHRPLDGLHDRGRRLLRDPRDRRRAAVHPRRLTGLRRRRKAGHPGRRGAAGLDGRTRRHRQRQRADRRPVGALRPARRPAGHRRRPHHRQPAVGRADHRAADHPADRHHDVRLAGRRAEGLLQPDPHRGQHLGHRGEARQRRRPRHGGRRPVHRRRQAGPLRGRSGVVRHHRAGPAAGVQPQRRRQRRRHRHRGPVPQLGQRRGHRHLRVDPVRRDEQPRRPRPDRVRPRFAAVVPARCRRHDHGCLLQRAAPAHRPPGPGLVQQPRRPGEVGQQLLPGRCELRRRPDRHGRGRRARRADVRCPGDVERRPRRGVHRPDRRPARFPGQQPRDHQLRRDPPGPGQPEAL